VVWRKQPTVALSSTEAEYKAAVSATCEAVWLKRILGDIGLHQKNPTPLMCDNQSVIKIAKKIQFIMAELNTLKCIIISFERKYKEKLSCSTAVLKIKQADLFTKSLGKEKFRKFRDMIGVKENEMVIKRGC
jgi:hypothetical protein